VQRQRRGQQVDRGVEVADLVVDQGPADGRPRLPHQVAALLCEGLGAGRSGQRGRVVGQHMVGVGRVARQAHLGVLVALSGVPEQAGAAGRSSTAEMVPASVMLVRATSSSLLPVRTIGAAPPEVSNFPPVCARRTAAHRVGPMSTPASTSIGTSAPGAGLRAVVTGASSGIGAATVRRLRADGWAVVAVARRADRLGALAAETGAQTVVADITSDDDVARLAREVAAGGPVHALVNNAGGALGQDPVATGSLDQWRQMYEINVLGTLRVTQALLPALRASGRGDVLVLSSTAALDTYPGGGGYVAAKHAERQIATTLRLELVGEPVRVLEIAPGMVHTDEFSVTRFGGDQARADAVYEGVVGGPLVADDVADAIAWVLSRPHHVNIDLLVIRPRAQVSNTVVARA
jgi:NADP-dependent 3-hydroxy acid dehydrogenase YdfG